MTGRTFALAAASGVFIALAQAAFSQQVQQHVAKVVCGTQADPKNLQLVQGFYASVVNILNISGTAQDISVDLALSHPTKPPEPGQVVEIVTFELDPGQAAAVDCTDIQVLAFPFGLPDAYIDGFVVIRSAGALTVKAVYTAAPLLKKDCCKMWPGPVASIDVETISPAEAPAGPTPQPDLLPDSPTLETDPLGLPGTGFCTEQPSDGSPPDAVALILNQGQAAAAASTARFDFGTFGQADINVPALDPGGQHQVGADIPRQCFGSGRANTCAFDIIADADLVVTESLETNNIRRGHCLRSAASIRQ